LAARELLTGVLYYMNQTENVIKEVQKTGDENGGLGPSVPDVFIVGGRTQCGALAINFYSMVVVLERKKERACEEGEGILKVASEGPFLVGG
jgi:hypothetical protein